MLGVIALVLTGVTAAQAETGDLKIHFEYGGNDFAPSRSTSIRTSSIAARRR